MTERSEESEGLSEQNEAVYERSEDVDSAAYDYLHRVSYCNVYLYRRAEGSSSLYINRIMSVCLFIYLFICVFVFILLLNG